MLQTAVAALATLVAVAFAMSTFERWLDRRRPHELAWSGALAMFAAASGALGAGSALGWTGAAFRLFFLFGAIANVPFLALGTVYLLGGRRWGDPSALAVALFGAFAAGVVVSSPFTAPLPRHHLARGSEVLGVLPVVLAAVGSALATLVIVGGALWSALRIRVARVMVANGLIALGTVVAGAGGVVNSVLDEMTGFAVTLAVAISILFAGFLVATTGPRAGGTGDRRSAADDEELDQGRGQDQAQQHPEDDGRAQPHPGASSRTATPGRSPSSSAADRRSRATETRP